MSKPFFTIGSDPEFILQSKDKELADYEFVEAHDLIPDSDCRKRIGCDGCSETGELRPRYSSDPLIHFKNLQALIRLSRTKYVNSLKKYFHLDDIRMIAGSGLGIRPVGGHIQFGVALDPFILNSLDRYLSIPLLFVELEPYNVDRRHSHSYGTLSNTRSYNYDKRFEYRTPASWILEPEIALGTICLAYTVVWESKYNGLKPEKLGKEVQDYFILSDKKKLKPYLTQALKKIRKMELYPQYLNQIDYLLKRITKDKVWKEKENVWKNWAYV